MSDAQATHRGAGRPPLAAKDRRHYQVNLALSESEMSWLRQKAQKLNLDLASAARTLLTARRSPSR